MKCRSQTCKHFMRSILVSHKINIPSMTFVHQIVLKICQNHWTVKCRSMTYIYFMKLIFVSHWTNILGMTLVGQPVRHKELEPVFVKHNASPWYFVYCLGLRCRLPDELSGEFRKILTRVMALGIFWQFWNQNFLGPWCWVLRFKLLIIFRHIL